MQKSSFVACPLSECRARLSNVGIGYNCLGDDVYKFNSVQKKDEDFSFYAIATLRASGDEGTDVTLELFPDIGKSEPLNAGETYEKFFARFFRLISQPVSDPFSDVGGATAVGIAAIIFAVLGGWLGIVLSLFGLLFYYKGDTATDLKGRKNCKIALGIVVAWIVLIVVYYIVIFALMGSAMTEF